MSERVVVAIVSFLIIADLLTGLLFNLHFGFYRIGIFIKSLTIFITFIICLPLVKKKSIQSIYLTLAILFLFWIIGSLISFFRNDSFDPGNSIIVLSRYFLFLILSCVFVNLAYQPSFEEKCRKIFETFFLVNNLFIIFGFIFKVDLFSTYNVEYVHRFGYKGLIYGGNEVAGIYVLGLTYFYRENFKYGESKKILLIMTCIAAVLTGTKATLVGLSAITVYYFIRYRIKVFIILMIPFILTLVYFVGVYWEKIKTQYLSFNVHFFETHDLITFLMSGRDLYIVRNFGYMGSEWSLINFITGDAFLYSETDLLDLYFFFGIGSILYLYLYVKIYFLKDKSLDNVFNFLVLMGIAFTAGHIIQSAVVPVFLLLFVFSNKGVKRNETLRDNSFN